MNIGIETETFFSSSVDDLDWTQQCPNFYIAQFRSLLQIHFTFCPEFVRQMFKLGKLKAFPGWKNMDIKGKHGSTNQGADTTIENYTDCWS